MITPEEFRRLSNFSAIFVLVILFYPSQILSLVSTDLHKTSLSMVGHLNSPRLLLSRIGSQHKNVADDMRIALLVDGDNAESSLVTQYIQEAGRFGKVNVRRIYADFSSEAMKGWKDPLNAAAFRTIHKFAYTTGKSSTDTVLIIDAMDLLHSRCVDGFCIVSSDSDYTGLAVRLREEGYFVMGIGRKHTPDAFVKACEKFTYAEGLKGYEKSQSNVPANQAASGQQQTKQSASYVLVPQHVESKLKLAELEVLHLAFQAALNDEDDEEDDDEDDDDDDDDDEDEEDEDDDDEDDDDINWATLSCISAELRKNDPSFKPSNFGFSSLKKFCEAAEPYFGICFLNSGQPNAVMCLRENQKLPPFIHRMK